MEALSAASIRRTVLATKIGSPAARGSRWARQTRRLGEPHHVGTVVEHWAQCRKKVDVVCLCEHPGSTRTQGTGKLRRRKQKAPRALSVEFACVVKLFAPVVPQLQRRRLPVLNHGYGLLGTQIKRQAKWVLRDGKQPIAWAHLRADCGCHLHNALTIVKGITPHTNHTNGGAYHDICKDVVTVADPGTGLLYDRQCDQARQSWCCGKHIAHELRAWH